MLLIFDWDGTLSDSTEKIIDCLQYASVKAEVDIPSREAILNIIGLGLPEAMDELYPNFGSESKERVRQEYSNHFLALDQTPSAFYDGVVDGLQKLQGCGFQMAVATGKSRKGLDRVLGATQTESFFSNSRCADETRSKPHPLMLQELLADYDVPAERAIMVGDTEYDMAMARSAGVHRAVVSYGAHHIDRLMSYDPLIAVDHFSVLVDWIISTSPQ